MTKGMYAVHDLVAAEYMHPFAANNDRSAMRAYGAKLRDLGVSSEDFELVQVGTYDIETGIMTSEDHPRIVHETVED